MKTFKLEICMTHVIDRLKRFNLHNYDGDYPTVFVNAEDPDEACHIAITSLFTMILKQDSSVETAQLLVEIKGDISIIRINQIDNET